MVLSTQELGPQEASFLPVSQRGIIVHDPYRGHDRRWDHDNERQQQHAHEPRLTMLMGDNITELNNMVN